MENLIKMDDLGGKPTIFGNIQRFNCWFFWGSFFLTPYLGDDDPVFDCLKDVQRMNGGWRFNRNTPYLREANPKGLEPHELGLLNGMSDQHPTP